MRLRNMRKTALLLAILLLLTATVPAAAATSLYWGSSGEMVRQVQRKLQKWGYLKGAADGVFGQDTYEAVVHFQRKNGLTADGVVGDATFAALGINTSSSSGGASTSTGRSKNPGPACAPDLRGGARGARILARWPSRRWCSTAWSTPPFPTRFPA